MRDCTTATALIFSISSVRCEVSHFLLEQGDKDAYFNYKALLNRRDKMLDIFTQGFLINILNFMLSTYLSIFAEINVLCLTASSAIEF
jgi:hypothetical protein